MTHKERRCNLFDDNGKPRRMKDGTRGCFRDASACHFAHPHERQWETAQPSLPPRSSAVADDDDNFYYILLHPDRHKDHRDREKEKERERERNKDRTREREKKLSLSVHASPPGSYRKDSATTIRGSPDPPSRTSTLDNMAGSGVTKRPRSPSAISSTSDQLERLRKDKHRFQDLPPIRRDSTASTARRSRSSSRGRGKDRRVDMPSNPPSAATFLVPQLPSPLPPEPPKSPPMQPPPPPPQVPAIPKLPTFVSNQPSASTLETAPRISKQPSMDEQRSAWHERIDLMFTSITSRRDYLKLESDLAQIHLLSNSSLFSNMPEADRARVNAQKLALEFQMATKRTEVNETIQKLIGSSFWPFLRTPQLSEMEKTLGDTKKQVLEVRTSLEEVKRSCEALFKTNAAEWAPDSDRPCKKRRLESEADTPMQPTNGNAAATTEATTKGLEEFRDKLTELDGHLADLQNDITQRDAIVSDEIELHIESRLQEEDALYPPVSGPKEVSEVEIEAVVDAKNKELVRAVTQTGDEIGMMAVEVAELITKVDALEAKCRALEAENQEFKNRLVQDTLQHARSQDDLLRRGKEVEAIAAALQAYISQAPAGQTVGDLPSPEYIIQSLDSQLDGLLRDKFVPKLGDIQREVYDMVQESQNRTIDTISPNIKLLLKMVSLIATRVEKPDMDAENTA